jgi:hypothetical protein
LALDIHAGDTSKILTGGADKNATVFNKDTEQIIAVLKGHTKKVLKKCMKLTATIYNIIALIILFQGYTSNIPSRRGYSNDNITRHNHSSMEYRNLPNYIIIKSP